jgi:peptidyl-prolyl cis-trans isomerase SurA
MVSEDSLGLLQYYEDHKNSYLTRRGINAKIYILKSFRGEKSLSSAYKKYSRKTDSDNRLIKKFNSKNDSLLIIKEGTWFIGEDPEIDKLKWVTGSQSFYKDGFPSIILIKKVIDPVPLKFDEVQGEMMTGYQEYLESEWIIQLKGKYNVKIDNIVLDEVKKMLKNE